ncbi:MAG: YqgE/AlgH family protein, partial [Chlamydiae bacterium]|nr:YqgE/AlgH family protein [Chlamydiota bacterium]
KGSLLIASPDLEGVYFRGVILICEHSHAGSFGLFINKNLDVAIPEELLDLKNAANPNVSLRSGGPIQPNQMMLLHSCDKLAEQTLKVCDGVYLGGDIQFLQEALVDPMGPHLRLCFGYAGWGPGMLEREYFAGAWFLHPGSAKYIFETPVEKIWQTVLQDMGGKYATLSMIPEDLSLN